MRSTGRMSKFYVRRVMFVEGSEGVLIPFHARILEKLTRHLYYKELFKHHELRRLHRVFCSMLARALAKCFYKTFLMFLLFKITNSHQKATGKVRTVDCHSKYYQNNFRS